MIRVTVWNEFRHEQTDEKVKEIYPKGIHECIADFLGKDTKLSVRTATLDMPEHGLTENVLSETDVLVFWNHMFQDEFQDEIADRVQNHVLAGMGLVVLHSGHYSKIMKRLLGTTMTLRWRHGDRERLFCTCPTHPIAQGMRNTLIITFRIYRKSLIMRYTGVIQRQEIRNLLTIPRWSVLWKRRVSRNGTF